MFITLLSINKNIKLSNSGFNKAFSTKVFRNIFFYIIYKQKLVVAKNQLISIVYSLIKLSFLYMCNVKYSKMNKPF